MLRSLLSDILGWRPPCCRCYMQRERICRYLFAKVMHLSRRRAIAPYSEEQSQWMLERIREKVRLYDRTRAFGMPTTERLCEKAHLPQNAHVPEAQPWESSST